MKVLVGGERIRITDRGNVVQTFERMISDAMQQHEGDVGEVWHLVTPMSAKQEQHLPTLPKKPDITQLPLDEQVDAIWDATQRRDRRRGMTDRSRKVISEDGLNYQLGHGIHTVSKVLLWEILDGLARAGESEIDAGRLDYFITYRRGDRR